MEIGLPNAIISVLYLTSVLSDFESNQDFALILEVIIVSSYHYLLVSVFCHSTSAKWLCQTDLYVCEVLIQCWSKIDKFVLVNRSPPKF